MSNEKLAREWARTILDVVDQNPTKFNEKARAAADYILENTTPQPMADVEWDDEKHHLAGATTSKGGSVVMFWHDDVETGNIITDWGEWPRDLLTPNGKRYRLVEDTAPAHPEHLVDEDDFEQAPEGTIVASDGYLSTPLVKRYGKWCRDRIEFPSEEITNGDPVRVLRWGWGK